MRHRSLLIASDDPGTVTLGCDLLPDAAPFEFAGSPVLCGPAPWRANHDLLVDPNERTLCGIVYPVPAVQRAAVRRICLECSTPIVRYCIAPNLAADLLDSDSLDLAHGRSDWGDPAEHVPSFPESLQRYRAMLRECLLGTRDRSDVPADVLEDAAAHFRSIASEDYSECWPGGTVDRVEVVWAPPPLGDRLPPHFPSMFRVELAQQFAEDIWLYRQPGGAIAGVGLNYLDEVLDAFGLALPPAIERRGA